MPVLVPVNSTMELETQKPISLMSSFKLKKQNLQTIYLCDIAAFGNNSIMVAKLLVGAAFACMFIDVSVLLSPFCFLPLRLLNMATTTESLVGEKKSTAIEPLSWKSAFGLWIRHSLPSLEDAEKQLLSVLPFYPEPAQDRQSRLLHVDIGNNLHLNEFEIENTKQSSDLTDHLVVVHGVGASSLFYLANFAAMSAKPGRIVHALDLLGFGNSARPTFSIKTKDITEKDEKGNFKGVLETENWFVDSLEAWRKAKGIDKFHLLGHSFGGYISLAYAGKYPERVKSLILVSPAGVSRGYTPDLEVHSLLHRPQPKPIEDQVDAVDPVIQEPRLEKPTRSLEMSRFLMYLWNKNVNPFIIVRHTGFAGYPLVSRWTHRRFKMFPDNVITLFERYSIQLFSKSSSGNAGVTRILAPGAVARMPMVDRVDKLVKCPSLWLYGDHDWMSKEGGIEASEKLSQLGRSTEAHTKIIKDAGHMIFLDNPKTFDDVITKFLDDQI